MRSFTTLVYKDYRLNRALIVGAFVLVPVTLFVDMMTQPWRPGPWPLWKSMLNSLSMQGIVLIRLAAIIVGARALAAECRDRSMEFLSALPPSRVSVVASKLLLSLGFLLALSCVLYILPYVPNIGRSAAIRPTFLESIAWLPNHLWYEGDSVLFLFGTAWLLSAFLSSPATCASGALVCGVVAAWFTNAFVPQLLAIEGENAWAAFYTWSRMGWYAAGFLMIVAGAVVQTVRTRP